MVSKDQALLTRNLGGIRIPCSLALMTHVSVLLVWKLHKLLATCLIRRFELNAQASQSASRLCISLLHGVVAGSKDLIRSGLNIRLRPAVLAMTSLARWSSRLTLAHFDRLAFQQGSLHLRQRPLGLLVAGEVHESVTFAQFGYRIVDDLRIRNGMILFLEVVHQLLLRN